MFLNLFWMENNLLLLMIFNLISVLFQINLTCSRESVCVCVFAGVDGGVVKKTENSLMFISVCVLFMITDENWDSFLWIILSVT